MSKIVKIAAIVVQYNNWKDTILCLESILQSYIIPQYVFVIDNYSTNDSVEKVICWASGNLSQPIPEYPKILPRRTYKPLSLFVTTPAEAGICVVSKNRTLFPKLFLIKNAANTGYAGGNNIGLRLGLEAEADAFWILNNDTIVDPGACGALYKRLCACRRPGLVGGLICYLTAPDIVQCRAGGYTDPWFFLSRMNGHNLLANKALQTPSQDVERELNFIYGASVMASRAFVETVGPMDERFFLYCEEQDWSWSATGKFDLAYAPDARIFHKEGGSIGMSCLRRPWWRLFLLARNRFLVTCKHKPEAVPFVCMGIIYAFFRLLIRRFMGLKNAG